jgi:putative transposase
MARRLRTLFAGIPTHVVQRGNDRNPCFFTEHDRHYYLDQLAECSQAFGCAVHAYVLMDNHVHLLVTPSASDGVSLLMKHVGQRYVQHLNRIRKRTGALWEGRFYSSVVDSGAYLFACHRYIEMNPVRARMVSKPGDFRWSSYRANGEGEESTLLTPHRDYLALSCDEAERRDRYRMLFHLSIDDDAIRVIREMTRGGYAFGSEDFRKSLAAASGRTMAPVRPRGLTPNPPLGV